jgi:hypothetical protein
MQAMKRALRKFYNKNWDIEDRNKQRLKMGINFFGVAMIKIREKKACKKHVIPFLRAH